MGETVGWRSFWWLNVGLFCLTFLTNVFLFPETKWHRVHPGELDTQVTTSHEVLESEPVSKLSDSEAGVESIEVVAARFPPLALSETVQKDPFLGKGAPSKVQFKLFQTADPHSNVKDEILNPWKLFALPIVQFAGFVVSWSASVFLTINLTQSQNFASPPYNYSDLTIGRIP
jgi:hypothetical protein